MRDNHQNFLQLSKNSNKNQKSGYPLSEGNHFVNKLK